MKVEKVDSLDSVHVLYMDYGNVSLLSFATLNVFFIYLFVD